MAGGCHEFGADDIHFLVQALRMQLANTLRRGHTGIVVGGSCACRWTWLRGLLPDPKIPLDTDVVSAARAV
jgi:hypothetical protein